jgi:hypothetical protein
VQKSLGICRPYKSRRTDQAAVTKRIKDICDTRVGMVTDAFTSYWIVKAGASTSRNLVFSDHDPAWAIRRNISLSATRFS